MAAAASKAVPEGADQTIVEFESKFVHKTMDWIEEVASRRFDNDVSALIEFLIIKANSETKERKRTIFLKVRCHNCSQHSPRGGDKRERTLRLPAYLVRRERENACAAQQCANVSARMLLVPCKRAFGCQPLATSMCNKIRYRRHPFFSFSFLALFFFLLFFLVYFFSDNLLTYRSLE